MPYRRIDKLPSRQLVTRLRKVQRDSNYIRSPQPVGGDIVRVQGLPGGNDVDLAGPVTIGYPGESGTAPFVLFSFQTNPNNDTLTLWNWAWSLYVDPASFGSNGIPDADSQWPLGTATGIYTGNLLQVTWWQDWGTSSDSTNSRMFYLAVHNSDTVSHMLYLAYKAYFPNLNQS